jgi:hypothetical protein
MMGRPSKLLCRSRLLMALGSATTALLLLMGCNAAREEAAAIKPTLEGDPDYESWEAMPQKRQKIERLIDMLEHDGVRSDESGERRSWARTANSAAAAQELKRYGVEAFGVLIEHINDHRFSELRCDANADVDLARNSELSQDLARRSGGPPPGVTVGQRCAELIAEQIDSCMDGLPFYANRPYPAYTSTMMPSGLKEWLLPRRNRNLSALQFESVRETIRAAEEQLRHSSPPFDAQLKAVVRKLQEIEAVLKRSTGRERGK